ncbi:Ribonuclease H [Handroanthus impetiginosus]|uniref:Ribonuclease H n=1 Tax=Handroanthus impetiginosus TaxID=429701 RepID=A0A2G9H0A2_9LAMI|nr:Ribonuclease H [Handroanthus impetiginosus]
MMHSRVECYVDNLVIKTKRTGDHLDDPRVVLDRLRKYNFKMNPFKCAFGVMLRKFLGFIVRHRELCSNNITEYQALIIGLQMAQEMDITELEMYGDSSLVINQLLNMYEVRKDNLVLYFLEASNLLKNFEDIALHHVPRKENRLADALANLATTLALLEGKTTNVPVCNQWAMPSLAQVNQEDANTISMSIGDEGDWRTPLVDYLKEGKLLQDPHRRADVRRRSSHFILYKDALYQRSFEENYQWCLNGRETVEAMSEAYSGICEVHQLGPKLYFQIKRMGYYWPTMVKDYLDYPKRCEACHIKVKKETGMRRLEKLFGLTGQHIELLPKPLYSLREALTAEDNVRLRLEKLEALDEKRLKAQQQLECDQARMMKAFNKKVRPRSFQVGDLVLIIRRPIITTQRRGNKFMTKWDSPCVVKEVYTNGAYKLVYKDRLHICPINENS